MCSGRRWKKWWGQPQAWFWPFDLFVTYSQKIPEDRPVFEISPYWSGMRKPWALHREHHGTHEVHKPSWGFSTELRHGLCKKPEQGLVSAWATVLPGSGSPLWFPCLKLGWNSSISLNGTSSTSISFPVSDVQLKDLDSESREKQVLKLPLIIEMCKDSSWKVRMMIPKVA